MALELRTSLPLILTITHTSVDTCAFYSNIETTEREMRTQGTNQESRIKNQESSTEVKYGKKQCCVDI